jgi:hypothetical protein
MQRFLTAFAASVVLKRLVGVLERLCRRSPWPRPQR